MATSTPNPPVPLRKRPRAPTLEFPDLTSPFLEPSISKRPRTTSLLIQELPTTTTSTTLPADGALTPSPPSPPLPLLSPSASSSSIHTLLSPISSFSSSSSSSSSDTNTDSSTSASESTLQNNSPSSSDDTASVASDDSSSSSSSSDADTRSQSTANDSLFTQFSLTHVPTSLPLPPEGVERVGAIEAGLPAVASLRSRLRDFLPALAAANRELETELREGRGEERDMERVEEGRYIEMELGLGVLEEKTEAEGSGESGGEGDGDEDDVLGRLLGRRSRQADRPGIEVVGDVA
ncbi:hypothetical protein MMC13_003442 [Lambiella insularis]|nr:hypothetical protein [Lambiella insularis]